MQTILVTGGARFIGSNLVPLLLEQGFEYVFRPIPNDKVFGERLAQYADETGYKRIAIIDNSTLYGTGLADNFYRQATDLGLHIVIHRGYLPWQNDFKALIAQIMKLKFDAIFLAGTLPQAAVLIKQLRQMGMNTPVIASDALNSQDLIDFAGKSANGIVVPFQSPSNPSNPAYLRFLKAFRTKYNQDADLYAAQGYDFINLLASVINNNNSIVPYVIASNLRHTQDWQGIMGNYSFEEDGELSESKILFKQIRNGQFVNIEE